MVMALRRPDTVSYGAKQHVTQPIRNQEEAHQQPLAHRVALQSHVFQKTGGGDEH